MIHDISALDPNKLYSYADYLTWQVQERLEVIKEYLFKMSSAPLRYHQELSGRCTETDTQQLISVSDYQALAYRVRV